MSSSESMLLRVVLLLQIVLLVTAFPKFFDENLNVPKRFCGRHLVDSLQYFCRNNYASHTSYSGKRSGDNEDYAYLSDEPLADGSQFAYKSVPFLANFRSARALRPRARRDHFFQPRGVADECCLKPCTLTELRTYCRDN